MAVLHLNVALPSVLKTRENIPKILLSFDKTDAVNETTTLYIDKSLIIY